MRDSLAKPGLKVCLLNPLKPSFDTKPYRLTRPKVIRQKELRFSLASQIERKYGCLICDRDPRSSKLTL